MLEGDSLVGWKAAVGVPWAAMAEEALPKTSPRLPEAVVRVPSFFGP